LEKLENNKIDRNSIAITFDDGFSNNLSAAFPILERYNVPATIFVATGYIDSQSLIWPETAALLLALTQNDSIIVSNNHYDLKHPKKTAVAYRALTRSFKKNTPEEITQRIRFLSEELNVSEEQIHQSKYFDEFRILNWNEVETLNQSDLVTFGSHSVNHKRLSRISIDEARFEIMESKKLLEDKVGNVDFFAYPFGGKPGDFTNQHVELVKKAGYRAAAACTQKAITVDSNIFELPRITVTADHTVDALQYILRGGSAFSGGFSLRNLIKGIVTGKAV
jgi:peptidoglycan/xylan/chitin deacetylase (PgdA/CDA1 family)